MRFALTCAVAAFVLLCAFARADEPTVVVIIAPDEPLAVRVEAELRSLGFVVKRAPVTDDSPQKLDETARSFGAAAAIRLIRSDTGAEVWVADRVTGKTLLREVTADAGDKCPDNTASCKRAEDVLAVRAVELLRASLLEIETAEPPPNAVPVTPVIRKVATPKPKENVFALEMGFGPQFNPTISPSAHIMVGFAWMPSRLGLEAVGLFPVIPADVCDSAGCARISQGMLGAGGRFHILPASSRFRPEVGLGFAGSFVHTEGHGEAGFTGVSSDGVVSTLYGHGGATLLLGSSLRLGLDMMFGSGLPPVTINFAGTEVGRWGGPFVSFFFRCDVEFR